MYYVYHLPHTVFVVTVTDPLVAVVVPSIALMSLRPHTSVVEVASGVLTPF